MQKPRRRAAGRAAGPPNPVRDEVAPILPPTTLVPLIAPLPAETTPETTTRTVGPAEEPGPARHRHRQRPARTSGAHPDNESREHVPDRPPEAAKAPSASNGPAANGRAAQQERRRGESSMERSLRALVSTRTTQLSPTIAMRAREVAVPSPADLAAAEEELVIVRRHYIPPAPLVTAKKIPDPKGTDARSTDGPAPEGRGKTSENRRGGRRQRG